MKEQRAFTEMPKPKLERIVLVPYHLSNEHEGECMHHVPVPETQVIVVCHNWAEESCVCCGKPTCEQHFSKRIITLEHGRIYGDYPLCLECSKFPRVQIEAIFRLQVAINEV